MNVNDSLHLRIFAVILAGKFTGTSNTCRTRNTLIVYASATWPRNCGDCTRGCGPEHARTRENKKIPTKIPVKKPVKIPGHGTGG